MSDRLNTPQLFHLVNGSTVSVALLHSTVCRSAKIHTCARRNDPELFHFPIPDFKKLQSLYRREDDNNPL